MGHQVLPLLMMVGVMLGATQLTTVPQLRIDDINIFLTVAQKVANHIHPNSSCYVCGLTPYAAGEGLPLMALPLSDCDTCRLLHVPFSQSYSHPDCPVITKMRPLYCSGGMPKGNCNRCYTAPKPVPILVIPKPLTWCLENEGSTPVGHSDCLQTFKWDQKQTHFELPSLISEPKRCLEAAGQAHLNALAHHSAMCSISSPVGMYWVCGNLAYPYLPVDYNGRCGIAYVIPAMRVTHALPGKPRQQRLRRGVSDIFATHHQSPFRNVVGALLPFYGIMSSLDQIADLSHAIEVIANETSKALLLISSELASVRLLALQNRAALDFLLAAQGGTCAIIGSECCTFVPDYNATISDIVTHLHDVAGSVHQEASSLFDWLNPTFRSMVYRIIEVLIIVVGCIVLASFLISCVKKFVQRMCM